MKTKDLIAALMEADPSGELEVGDGNADIYFVERQESYYDGSFQQLIRDKSKEPYYCITGCKVWASGQKVKLHLMGCEDVISNNPDATVDLSDLEARMPVRFAYWQKQVEEWRKETRDIIEKVEREHGARDAVRHAGIEAAAGGTNCET